MFDTNPRLLSQVLDSVESGKIKLPDFQRGWIWDDDRIRALLASISRGFPIGAVMTLEAGGDISLKSRLIEGATGEGAISPESYLLDGQQRLTSLYQALRHPGAVDTSDSRRRKIKRWYYVDMQAALDKRVDREDAIRSLPENRIITEDFGRKEVLNLSTPEREFEKHMMPTEALLGSTNWLLGYVAYWASPESQHPGGTAPEFFKEFQESVLNNFTNYQLPVIELGKETPKEAVCTVFEKVNTGGVSLNVFELATATFAVDGSFSLRDDWDERRTRLHSKRSVLHGLSGDQFLQAVALLKTQEDNRSDIKDGALHNRARAVGCRKRDILDLRQRDYLRWAEALEDGFIKAANFLRSQYVFGRWNVPYNTQLVPLAALYVELGHEAHTAIALERLERWYWSGVFGEIYGGAVETQFARDLVDVAEYVRTGVEPPFLREANFVPERLISLRTRNSAAYKGVYALQLKNGAQDWMTAESLSFTTYDDRGIDIHHIFPVAWCISNRIDRWLHDSIINKTPMDPGTNRSMGGRAPSVYLNALQSKVPEGKLDALLESHWLKPDHLHTDDFRASFMERGQEMLTLIGAAMGRDLGDGRRIFSDALDVGGVGVIEQFVDDGQEFDEVGESEEETDAA